MSYQRENLVPAAKSRAFTLVELLVVIAIISVLAALLMPALRGALIAARQAECANKLKQHHLALTLYADDWDVYPTLWGWPNGMIPAGSFFYAGDPTNKYYLWSEALMLGGYITRAPSRAQISDILVSRENDLHFHRGSIKYGAW